MTNQIISKLLQENTQNTMCHGSVVTDVTSTIVTGMS